MNPLEKIKLIKGLKVAVDNRNNESNPIKKIKLIKEIQAIRTKLGFVKAKEPTLDVENKEPETPPQDYNRMDVSDLFKHLEKVGDSLGFKSSVETNLTQTRYAKYVQYWFGAKDKDGKEVLAINTDMYNNLNVATSIEDLPSGQRYYKRTKGYKRFFTKSYNEAVTYITEQLQEISANNPDKLLTQEEIAYEKLNEWEKAKIGLKKLASKLDLKAQESIRYDSEEGEEYPSLNILDKNDNLILTAYDDLANFIFLMDKDDERISDKVSGTSLLSTHTDVVRVAEDYIQDNLALSEDEKTEVPEEAEKPISEDETSATFDYTEVANTISKRQKINNECEDIVKAVQDGELDINDVTPEQKAILSQFSGYGGGVKNKRKESVGSSYEYYTPKEIADSMWGLAKELGFEGGKVLDPCSGTGIFSATAPKDGVLIDSVELDSTSGTINKILFNDDTHTTTISPFEKVATDTPEETYDLVIANVPFGDNSSRGSYKTFDERYQSQSLEGYFILRSLDKLKPNALAVFMSGTSVMDGKNSKNIRKLASEKAEFIGAYRLPNKLFESAGADVITDVLVFKKHNSLNAEIIQELKQGNVKTLQEANAYYKPFIDGKYFKENKRNILGEEVTTRSRYGTDVIKVVNNDSIGNIAKLMKNLGGSRIDWDLLQGTEPEIINYKNGDIVYQGGIAKEWQDGRFINAKLATEEIDEAFRNRVAQYGDIVSIVENSVDLDVLAKDSEQVQVRAMSDSLSDDQRITFQFAREYGADNLRFGLRAFDMVTHREAGKRVNMLEKYPNISLFCKAVVLGGVKARGLKGEFKALFEKVKKTTVVYDKKEKAYNPLWLGQEPEMEDVVLDDTQKYEQMLYTIGAGFGLNGGVPVDEFKAKFPNVDLDNSEEWCYSLDGKNILSSGDYYQGKFGDFKEAHLEAIKNTNDVNLINKLKKQLSNAESKLNVADVQKITFDITTKFVKPHQKLIFLNKFIATNTGEFSLKEDGESIEYKSKSYSSDKDKEAVLKRLAIYINKSSFSTGAKDEETRVKRMEILREQVILANSQFDAWVKSQESLIEEIDERINNPEHLTFNEEENNSRIKVVGLKDTLNLHGYQSDYVRKQSRKMGGICGFDVGLGKTFTALATVQHLQSIGVKKKTVFVVPNTTLTNWRKESQAAYTPEVFEKCLFVGVREKNGNLSVNSSDVPKDIALISKNEHNKIYMSFEAFTAILMADKTIEKYAESVTFKDSKGDKQHLESEREKLNSYIAKMAKQLKKTMSSKYDFLESMNIDSIVIDEAHTFKNAKSAQFGGRVKWLSLAPASARGVNMLMKTWYIRGKNVKNDGVLCLTATPVTNSPLEIYSMLSLAVGEDEVKAMTGINNVNDFLEAFCYIEQREEQTITGDMAVTEVFSGLKSTVLLKKALNSTTVIRNADDTPEAKGEMPESEEIATQVQIPKVIKDEIDRATEIYKAAKEYEKEGTNDKALVDFVESEMARTGETAATMSHPFNFISKLSKMMLDSNLHDEISVYSFNKEDLPKVEEVVKKFNSSKVKESRVNKIGIDDEDILEIKEETSKESDELKVTKFIVHVTATINQNEITLTSTDFEIQSKFLKLCEKAKIKLDCEVSAKMAALIENINTEKANSKDYKGGNLAKQIVFCDLLGVHHNIKMVIAKHCKIPSSKICIVNAKAVPDQGQLQEIQDGFNAFGKENKYELIIANKKAEVGINLQKGCQAIHHLTIGWTPDSLQQRNGRGVRQGNKIKGKVNIYHYDTSGSFDSYKRKLVNNKANWINELLHGNGEKVKIENEAFSREEMDLLAEANGDPEKFAELEVKLNEARKKRVIEANRKNFKTVLNTYEVAKREVTSLAEYDGFYRDLLTDLDEDFIKVINKEINLYNQAEQVMNTFKDGSVRKESMKGRLQRKGATIKELMIVNFRRFQPYFGEYFPSNPKEMEAEELIGFFKKNLTYQKTLDIRKDISKQEKEGGKVFDKYIELKAKAEKYKEQIAERLDNLSKDSNLDERHLKAMKLGRNYYLELKNGDILCNGDIIKTTMYGEDTLGIIDVGWTWSGVKVSAKFFDTKDFNLVGETSVEPKNIVGCLDSSSPKAINFYESLAKEEIKGGRKYSKLYPILNKFLSAGTKIEIETKEFTKFIVNLKNSASFFDSSLDFGLPMPSDINRLKGKCPNLIKNMLTFLEEKGVYYENNKCLLASDNEVESTSYDWPNFPSLSALAYCVGSNLVIEDVALVTPRDRVELEVMARVLGKHLEVDESVLHEILQVNEETKGLDRKNTLNYLFDKIGDILLKNKIVANKKIGEQVVKLMLSTKLPPFGRAKFLATMNKIYELLPSE